MGEWSKTRRVPQNSEIAASGRNERNGWWRWCSSQGRHLTDLVPTWPLSLGERRHAARHHPGRHQQTASEARNNSDRKRVTSAFRHRSLVALRSHRVADETGQKLKQKRGPRPAPTRNEFSPTSNPRRWNPTAPSASGVKFPTSPSIFVSLSRCCTFASRVAIVKLLFCLSGLPPPTDQRRSHHLLGTNPVLFSQFRWTNIPMGREKSIQVQSNPQI